MLLLLEEVENARRNPDSSFFWHAKVSTPRQSRGLYEAPRVKEIFRLKEIFFAFFLSELVGREQHEACVCIHGMIALFAWPRRAVNPRSPQGRERG